MPAITSHACDYHQDGEKLLKLWASFRAASDIHAYPTIWRVRLLWTSRVWEPEKDAQIWENEAGEILGFAMLWRREKEAEYAVLDGFVNPALVSDELLSSMTQWGDERIHEMAKTRNVSISIYFNGFSQTQFPKAILATLGYTILPPDEGPSPYFGCSLLEEIPEPVLPDGYVIRPLRNTPAELETYQKLYDFAGVSPEHQQELLESDEYWHLVMVGPQGEFTAYAEISLCRAEWASSGQKIGWLDYIGTAEKHQRKGFGRAILLAAMRHLQQAGAEEVMLVTMNENIPAVTLYERTGFERVNVPKYGMYQKEIQA